MNDTSSELQQISVVISETAAVSKIARALSIPQRIKILELLSEKNVMSVNQIAVALNLPISSASMHVSVLEDAGLVSCERMSSIHGTMKMCARKVGAIQFHLRHDVPRNIKHFNQELPLGAYSAALDVTKPCGLASMYGPIGVYNRPECFFMPERLEAQMIWLKSGTLTYEFSTFLDRDIDVEALELSFEACAQARMHDEWKTEILVSVNGKCLGSCTCTCDANGRRGTFNPDWWPDVATQHGDLLKWRVTKDGVYLRDQRLSDVTLNDLNLSKCEKVSVQLRIPSTNENASGLNLFGTGFGNYNQAIGLSIAYRKNERNGGM